MDFSDAHGKEPTGSIIKDEGNSLGETLGSIMKKLESELNLPKDKLEPKQSWSLDYDISAKAVFHLKEEWEIFKGFKLEGVKLKIDVSKSGKKPAILSVEINAYLMVNKYKAVVTGKIPFIEKGRDIEFVLKVEGGSKEALDTEGLIDSCTKGDADGKDAAKESSHNLIEKAGLVDDAVDAARAELIVVRTTGSGTFFLKKFEIKISAKLEWNIIPGKFRLENAAGRLHFSKKNDKDPFLAELELAGRVSLQDPPKAKIGAVASLSLHKGDIVLGLKCNVSAGKGVDPTKLVGLIADQKVPDLSSELVKAPPSLDLKNDNSWAFFLSAALERKEGKWAVRDVSAAIQVQRVWAPFPKLRIGDVGAVVVVCRPELKVDDGDDSTDLDQPKRPGRFEALEKEKPVPDDNTDSKKLKLYGWLTGVTYLYDLQLKGTVQYDSGILHIRCHIPDTKPTSFPKILANPRIHSLKDDKDGESKNSPTEDELSKTLESTAAPNGCPVDFWMASSLYYGTERKCRISFKGSSLHELEFVARSAGAENGWELTEAISIHDMGLSISYKAPTDPKTGKGALKGYAYGHLKLSNSLTLFVLVAGQKEDQTKEFFLHVSATLQPQGSVGVSPKKLFEDPALKGLNPQTEGWQLPSSLPAEQRGKISDLFQSASVGVSLKMAQKEVTKQDDETPKTKTSLVFAHVYLDLEGNWAIFDGLCLQNLSLHALIMPAASNKPEESSTTKIQLKGAFHVPSDDSGYYIVMSALLDKQKEASSFTASLTATSNAGTSQDRVAEDSQQRRPLSPSSVLGLAAFGGKELDATDQGSVPTDFPVQPTEFQSSTNVECPSEVGKNKETGKWELNQVVFSLSSDKEWEVIPGLLSMKLLRFDLQVKNPKEKTREILASAAVDITINKLLVKSTLLFRTGQQGNILLFELKVLGENISPMLQHLTAQSAESLTPSETPKFKDDALFTVRIICAWIPDNAATGKTKRWLQSIEIDYQPTDKLDLDPFQVRNLQLSLLWKPPGTTVKRTAPEVSFKGEVVCGQVPVDIALSYEPSPSRQWVFKLLPHEEKPLHLSDICQTDKKKDEKTLPKPKYDLPTGSQPLDGLKMSGIHGAYGLRSTNVPKSKLLQLDADIESGQVIDILDLGDGVKIQLFKLSLHWKYRDNNSKPESTGQVFAHLGCRKNDGKKDPQKNLKSDVLVEFKKEQDGREIFKGLLELNESHPDTDQPINYEELLEKFLPPDSHENPKGLEAPSEIPLLSISVTLVRHQSIELSAKGKTQWNLPLEGTKIHLDYLGLYLKAEKAGQDKDVKSASANKTAIEVAITGGLTLNSLQSTDALRASLSIKRGSAKILRASLKRSKASPKDTQNGEEGDLKQLIRQLTGTPLNDIAPGVETSLTFNETADVQLCVDFTKASNFRMILRGEIVGLGTVFFFTRKGTESASKREYVVYAQSPSLKNLIDMSSSFSSDIQGTFDLAPVEAGVISYNGTVKEFNADINEDIKPDPDPKSLKSSEPATQPASATPSPTEPLLMIPGEKHLNKGFWVFAGIHLGGEGSMTEAIKAVTNPQRAPKVAFYGMISAQSREYGILINDLYILDECLRIDQGSGIYLKDNTTKDQSLSLKGTLSLLGLGGNGVDYSIDVDVAITSSKTTFSVQKSASYKIIEVDNPLGEMFNVTLSLQSISGEIAYEHGKVLGSEFSLVGRAALAGKSPIKNMEGRIIFSNGTPQVVAADFKKLPVQGSDGLFGSVIQPNAEKQNPASWPDDYPDLELIDGSIYYAKKEITFDEESSEKKRVYHAGYNVGANLKLLGVNFEVLVAILPKRAGVSISSILKESIDLSFIKLSEVTLAVLAKKGAKEFSINSDVEFFEEVDLALTLSYEPASKSKSKSARYSGKLSRKEDKQQKPFVTIRYQDGSWGFEDWDIPWQPENGLRLEKAIEKATQSQSDCECEALVGMVFKEVIVPKFNWKITSPADKAPMFKNGTLNMRVVWSYNITVSSLGLNLLGFSLPDIPLTLKGPFKHEKIHELLLKVIDDNLEKIGKAILDRPDDFFKVISVIALDRFAPKIIASLVCRQKKADFKAENLQKRAKDLIDEEINEGHQNVHDDTNKLEDLETAIPGILAGGGGGKIGGLLAGLASLAALLLGKKPKPVTDASPDDIKKDFVGRLKGLEEAQERLRKRAMELQKKVEAALALTGKPRFEVISEAGKGEQRLLVDWTKVLPAFFDSQSKDFKESMSWTVDISSGNDENVETIKTRGLTLASCSLPSGASEGTIFKARVRGSCQCSETTYTAPWSSPASLTYTSHLPVPPDNVMFYQEYDQEPSIKVEFTPTADGDYEFTLVPSVSTFNALYSTQASITCKEGYQTSWKMISYLEQLKKFETLWIWVRQVRSPMESQRTPSAWVPSKHKLRIASYPSLDPVTGFYSEGQALLEWHDAWKWFGLGYLVQRIDASGAVVQDLNAFEETEALPGTKAFTVNNPDHAFPGEGHQGEVLISPVPALADKSTFLLPQRFHVKLDRACNLSIRSDSLVLQETKQVALHILGEAHSPNNDPEAVVIEALGGKGHVPVRRTATAINIKDQYFLVFWPADPPLQYVALRVTAVDPTRPSRRLGLPSKPWDYPDTTFTLTLPRFRERRIDQHQVRYSWANTSPSENEYWFIIGRENHVRTDDPHYPDSMFEKAYHTKENSIILPIGRAKASITNTPIPTHVCRFITRDNVLGPRRCFDVY